MNFSSKFVLKKNKAEQNDNARCQLAPGSVPDPDVSKLLSESGAEGFKSTTTLLNNSGKDAIPDTNVLTITFSHLKEPKSMHAGDPIKCAHCDAYLSHISKVNVNSASFDSQKLWICEFCGFNNNLNIDQDEIPKVDDVTYMLEPAILNNPGTASTYEKDSEFIIYCIDISGSMSVTTEVQGNFKLPTDKLRREREAKLNDEPYFRPPQRAKHVTRLEAVQVAIAENLAKLEVENPKKRVGLVTFNHEVTAYGDGFTEQINIAGMDLDGKLNIQNKANSTGEYKTVKETKKILHEKLIQLEEGGATALGPALYYSILIASRKPGSQVILCTDGLANKGIGALDTNDDCTDFYNDLATLATSNGVSVSIITIEGTNCKLGLLGEIALKTGGVVDVVDPLNMKSQFTSIIEDQIIATNVVAKFLAHRAMYIRDYENLHNRQSVIVRNVGNVTQDTEITFEFGMRDDANIDENVVKEVPFQLQITYTSKDGSKAMRTLTQLRPITSDRKVAEENADRTVLATHFSQLNARLMQQGPQLRNFYETNHVKWDGYIRNLKNSNEDEFSMDEYSKMESDMRDVMKPINNMNVEGSANAYSKVADKTASKGFKLANIQSRFLKKK